MGVIQEFIFPSIREAVILKRPNFSHSRGFRKPQSGQISVHLIKQEIRQRSKLSFGRGGFFGRRSQSQQQSASVRNTRGLWEGGGGIVSPLEFRRFFFCRFNKHFHAVSVTPYKQLAGSQSALSSGSWARTPKLRLLRPPPQHPRHPTPRAECTIRARRMTPPPPPPLPRPHARVAAAVATPEVRAFSRHFARSPQRAMKYVRFNFA